MPTPSFDVRVYGIRTRKNAKAPTYELRWQVDTTPFSRTFKTKTLADGRRAKLLTAVHNGEAFDRDSGLPMSELRAMDRRTWFEHATEYAKAKWSRSSAKSRAARADALGTVTPALVTDRSGSPDPAVLRRALTGWAFNHSPHIPDPPPEVVGALEWIARKSLPLSELEKSEVVRMALDALALKLDGTPAAATTITRKRMVFNNALRYAVERRKLAVNPLHFVDWSPPETDDEIDFRYVPNPEQARALLRAVGEIGPRGRHLEAFFACIYYAGMRPAEVTDLKRPDCVLPDDGWGTLVLAGSSPSAGTRWTDDGETHDVRGLKRRARRSTREVPIPPVLVAILRKHLETHGTAPDGRLFRAARGGRLRSNEYPEVWKAARRLALTEEEAATPLAEVPYSLRHACVSLWLTSGVSPTEVARRAGHSVAVLFRFYAKVLHGQQEQANRQIERALRPPE